MKTPRFPRSRRLGINMTPMIDVVFLLIVFFLVSNHLVRQESRIAVELPQAISGETDVPDNRVRMTVTVLADGTIYLSGQPISPEDMERRLALLIAQEGKDVEIRVRASRDLPYRLIAPLMVTCAKQGIWNLTFAVHEPEGN
jgi:biopolymer transport protein ExbD